jgi:peptidase M28-like protein
MKKSILFLGIITVLYSCGSSINSNITPVKAPANVTEFANTITSAELKEMLNTYASDEFEGRETGQLGQKKAVEYIKNHYVNLGIPSPISKGNYFQEVPLQIVKTPNTTLIVNGTAFNYFDDYISLTAAPTGQISSNEIVYLGYGIDHENYSDYNAIDVKGKIIVVKGGEPKNEDSTYKVSGTNEISKWSNGRQSLSAKREAAKKHGAKAVFFMDNALFYRYSGYYKMSARNGGSKRLSLINQENEIYFFLINESLGKTLIKNIEENTTVAPITGTIALNYESVTTPMSSENVVAFIEGSEKPDEYIIISAHLDHEGIKYGSIYNGADDDGSGTVAIIEIAEAFKAAVNKGYKPKRSILFLHVTAEEKGLLGSKYYTDYNPIVPLKSTVANLNIDMIGRIDPKREGGNRNYIYLIGSDRLSTELHKLSEEVNTKYTNIELDYKYNDENDPSRFYYRSDHYNFAKNNVPIIFYFNGTHADYHKPTDTPDKIEYDLLENRTRLIFYTAWELANRDERIIVDKATD